MQLRPSKTKITTIRAYPKKIRVFEEIILKSWWTILFFFLSLFAYEQASARKDMELAKLKRKMQKIELAIKQASIKQEDLQRELASVDDDSSIELVLMQKLGLVPEGQTKIYIKEH